MSKFDRYMLSQLLMVFGFFALVLVSVYWVNSAVRLFDRLISDGQSVWVFLEMSALSLPNVIRLMLPVAAFVAVLYTTNRMSDESELVVMQATGFSPFRLARPVLYFALTVALLVAMLANVLVPRARNELNVRNDEINQNVSARLLTEGTFTHPSPAVTLYIRSITRDGELRDLFLSDARQTAETTIYTAKRAYIVKSDTGPKLVMFDGMAQTLTNATRLLSATRYDDLTYDIAALIASRGPRHRSLEERSTPALFSPSAKLLEETGATRGLAIFEANDRITKPLFALSTTLMAFAAMLGGNYTRFGLWRQMTLASCLFILLYLLSNVADRMAMASADRVWVAYVPALAGMLLAVMLLRWAGRRRASVPPFLSEAQAVT